MQLGEMRQVETIKKKTTSEHLFHGLGAKLLFANETVFIKI